MLKTNLKKSSLFIFVFAMFSSSAFAVTYKSYNYQDISTAKGIDEEANVDALLSADRMIMTIQALILEKKMSRVDTIRSIKEVDINKYLSKRLRELVKANSTEEEIQKALDILQNEEDRMANIVVDIDSSGQCKRFQAKVQSGYLDENGKAANQMNTWVKFIGKATRCN